MRSICLGSFVLICGCISHLSLNPQNLSDGVRILADLYTGGADGSTGGALCGGIAVLVNWLCGRVLSYILFVLGAIFTLLGGMHIRS